MTVGSGEVVFRMGQAPCTGVGIRWTDEELNAALNGPVGAVLFDDEGKALIAKSLQGVADSEFANENLRRLMEGPESIKDWRVGEAIAEAYLVSHRKCTFPWPTGRDEKRRGSSLPGADLVGFGTDSEGHCFAFGEVKTSSEAKYPPGAMYGSGGLKQQLEDLCNNVSSRNDLVKYLLFRSTSVPWKKQFERALQRFLNNNSDCQLYGCLVRDVKPHCDDLRVRVASLGTGCPVGTRIELLAIYLPHSRLDGIGAQILQRRRPN
ncbi:MAG: hypothetical protein OXB95_07290 [Rhodobacteraceae bacterium]|nr:hypothetical protein [Paracoccaceae bacterium]